MQISSGNVCECTVSFQKSGKINQDFQESMMIPKTALVENGQLTGVYVVSSQNTAVLRWLKTEKLW
jgi:hypothetical protein